MRKSMLRALHVSILTAGLFACGGGGGSSGAGPNEPTLPNESTTNTVSISGTITFDRVPQREVGNGLDYNNQSVEPARAVTVELVNNAGIVQGKTSTNAEGQYQLTVAANTAVTLQVKAEMQSVGNPTWDVRVTDNTQDNALYLIKGSSVTSGTTDSTRNLHAASGWDRAITRYTGPRSAAPLAILDVIYDAMQQFISIDPSVSFPPLEIRWSSANTTASGALSEGDIGTSFYSRADSAIYLVGSADNDTDEYDKHVIAHEWGHYIEDKLSRSDSIGGPHGIGDRLDMRVSFSEGFGYALAALVLQDSVVKDSFGLRQDNGFSFDVESNETINPGWYSEASVQSILYDVADTDTDGADRVATGLTGLYRVMTSNAFRNASALATLYLFLTEFEQLYPEHRQGIRALLEAQAVFGTDEWGSEETNDAGQETVLPVYTLANLATRKTLCTSSEFNSVLNPSRNKLGNSVFIRYPNVTGGAYTISLERVSGNTRTMPSISLYRNGSYILDVFTDTVDTISWTGNLNAGSYVLVLSEADAIPGCYSLGFSNN